MGISNLKETKAMFNRNCEYDAIQYSTDHLDGAIFFLSTEDLKRKDDPDYLQNLTSLYHQALDDLEDKDVSDETKIVKKENGHVNSSIEWNDDAIKCLISLYR